MKPVSCPYCKGTALFELNSFADVVGHRIQKEGLTLRQAAKSSLVSHATLSRVVNGETPSIQTWSRLALWCNLTATESKELMEKHL